MVSARRTGTNENVQTYGNGTRNFTSLATWESATDNDLVTGMVSEVLECYDDAASFDDRVGISGAITDSSFMRIIRAASGQGHDGTPNIGVTFTNTGVARTFIVAESNFKLQDIIVAENSASGSTSGSVDVNADACEIVGVLAANATNSGAALMRGIRLGGDNTIAVDCLASGCDDSGFFIDGSGDTIYLYNCTAVGNGETGFEEALSTATIAKNCLSGGNTTSDFAGSFAASSVTNASSDGTAPGAGSRINQTFTFVNAGGDDYHLDSSDAGAKDFGTDLSGDGVFAFDDDVDGDLWGTWDIGFDEPGVGDVPRPGHTYQHQEVGFTNIGFRRSWSN